MKQKKLLALLLVLCMVLSLLPTVAFAEGETYEYVEATALKTGDIVVITMTTSDGVFAASNDKGTNSAPAATTVTASSTKLDGTIADNLKWQVTITDSSYQFSVPGTSNYLYCTNTNNGVRVGTNANNVFTIKDDYLYNIATSRYIGVYNSQDWRCYTTINNNIKGQTLSFWKKTEASGETYSFTAVSNNTTWGTVETSGNTITATPAEGYYVVDATVDPEDAATITKDGDKFTVSNLTANCTVTVNFAALTPVTVTFDANGGSGSMEPETAYKEKTYELPESGFTAPEGYQFSGWKINNEGDLLTLPTGIDVSGYDSITLVAQWAKKTGVNDELTNKNTIGNTTTSYTSWTANGTSGAVYAGQSAGDHESIQLRSSNSNSGIVTTTSGGKVKKVSVTWNSNTTSGRTLNVYGKNTAYSAATDLYNSSNQGTLLGTIVYGTSTELTVSDEYTYIGLRSASGAMYLDGITITWEPVEAPAEEIPAFKSHSLVLSDDIGINFFLDLPAIEGVDYSNSYMTFEISGKGTTTAQDDFDADDKDVTTGKYYGFTCYVNSLQMADTVTATFHYGDNKTVTNEYSIKKYIDDTDLSATNKTTALVKALADYGHYAQLFLQDAHSFELGTAAGYATMDTFFTDYGTNADTTLDGAIAEYAIQVPEGKPSPAYALSLDGKTSLRVYFTDGTSFTLDDTACETTTDAKGRNVVTISGLSAHMLSTQHTIRVDNTYDVKISALSYMAALRTADTYKNDANARNAAYAFYKYATAADAYIAD